MKDALKRVYFYFYLSINSFFSFLRFSALKKKRDNRRIERHGMKRRPTASRWEEDKKEKKRGWNDVERKDRRAKEKTKKKRRDTRTHRKNLGDSSRLTWAEAVVVVGVARVMAMRVRAVVVVVVAVVAAMAMRRGDDEYSWTVKQASELAPGRQKTGQKPNKRDRNRRQSQLASEFIMEMSNNLEGNCINADQKSSLEKYIYAKEKKKEEREKKSKYGLEKKESKISRWKGKRFIIINDLFTNLKTRLELRWWLEISSTPPQSPKFTLFYWKTSLSCMITTRWQVAILSLIIDIVSEKLKRESKFWYSNAKAPDATGEIELTQL